MRSKETANSKHSNEIGLFEGQKGYNGQSTVNKENGKIGLRGRQGPELRTEFEGPQ